MDSKRDNGYDLFARLTNDSLINLEFRDVTYTVMDHNGKSKVFSYKVMHFKEDEENTMYPYAKIHQTYGYLWNIFECFFSLSLSIHNVAHLQTFCIHVAIPCRRHTSRTEKKTSRKM